MKALSIYRKVRPGSDQDGASFRVPFLFRRRFTFHAFSLFSNSVLETDRICLVAATNRSYGVGSRASVIVSPVAAVVAAYRHVVCGKAGRPSPIRFS
jgi:hypothetical protein